MYFIYFVAIQNQLSRLTKSIMLKPDLTQWMIQHLLKSKVKVNVWGGVLKATTINDCETFHQCNICNIVENAI